MWERGLKLPIGSRAERLRLSLPMWERGLKLSNKPHHESENLSLPMWERGLKHQLYLRLLSL